MWKSGFTRAAGAGVILSLLALFGAGCSDTNPAAPTPPNGDAVLMGYQDEQTPFFTLLDPGTPLDFTDDQLLSVGLASITGDTTAAVLQAIDYTPANVTRPYRGDGTGDFHRLLDFDVPASDRLIGRDTDLFLFHDGEGTVGASRYFATMLVGGLETRSSARTNTLAPWGRTQPSLVLSINRIQRDSVLSLSFTPDPGAAAYILEIAGFDDINLSRDLGLLAALPLPVSMPHQFSGWGFLLPGQETTIRIPFFHVPFIRGLFPLTLLVRVIALDANGRVIGRSQPDYIQRNLGRDDSGNTLYELDPLGGWIMVLNPYPSGATPTSLRAAAPGTWTGEAVSARLARTPALPASKRVTAESSLREVARLALQRRSSPYQELAIGIGRSLPAGILRRARE